MIKYRTEKKRATVKVTAYVRDFVNVEQFLEMCKDCDNYGKKWSCPPFEFDPYDYWNQFKDLKLVGTKIIFDEEERNKDYTKEEINKIINEVLTTEKEKLTNEMFEGEYEIPGSISLSAGSCNMCGDEIIGEPICTRMDCKPSDKAKDSCRHFDKMRYSIEALGGNVGKTCHDLLEEDLAWIEGGKLPDHYMLVCGLLMP